MNDINKQNISPKNDDQEYDESIDLSADNSAKKHIEDEIDANEYDNDSGDETISQKHKIKMQKLKKIVDESVANANIEKGIVIVITGNGKGKSTSAFGTLARALGHGKKTAVVQFLKGTFITGESLFFSKQTNCEFYAIGDGFTWDTQDRESDIKTAELAYAKTTEYLSDSSVDLVVLDEITYMFKYKYLNVDDFVDKLKNRPKMQSVIITGRGAGRKLREFADTVSVIAEEKHAFRAGVKAQKGVDW